MFSTTDRPCSFECVSIYLQGKTRKLRKSEQESEGRETMENPNCRTKLSRNQVPGNPRAFKYFGTIAKANYVADIGTDVAL
ncbi:unnamed protein product [Lasius platythorax]|uniref:Uncharacterized protein n=1 Tax=Lasius platythorax TaxID=488582 RepID=A0AAV2NSY4_9HYME